MLGIVAVVARLRSSAVAPVLHLRTVNPHVANLLDGGGGSTPGKLLRAVAARAAGPAVDVLTAGGGEKTWHSGVSSFAFQVAALTLPQQQLAARCVIPRNEHCRKR